MQNRGNKIAVKRMIQRGGKSFQQTFWVSPARAKQLRDKAQEDVKATVKAGTTVFDAMKSAGKTKAVFEKRAAEIRERFPDLSDEDLQSATRQSLFNLYGLAADRFKEDSSEALETVGAELAAEKEKRVDEFVGGSKKLLLDIHRQKRDAKRKAERADVDEVALRDLQLFLANDADLYHKIRQPLEDKFGKIWENNRYDEDNMARALERQLLHHGAQKYMHDANPEYKKMPVRERVQALEDMFPKELRQQLAKDMAAEFTDRVEIGEYGEGGHRNPRLSGAKKALTKSTKKMGDIIIPERHQASFEEAASSVGLHEQDILSAYAAADGYDFEVMYVGPVEGGSGMMIRGEIYADDGTEVGEMSREIRRDEDGSLHVEHNMFKLNAETQDTNVGTTMVLNQFEHYEEMGVSSVSLTSAWVGKYLWMKLGFVPTEESAYKVRRFATKMLFESDLSPEQIESIMPMIDGNLNDFARMKGLPEIAYQDPNDGEIRYAPANKAMLLDDRAPGWSGRIDVGGDDWATTKEILHGYIN